MRVYFGVCGIGLGHVGRCIPIAKKLGEEGAEILFSTYRDGANYLQQEIFSFVKSPSIGFRVKPDGTVDFRQTAVNPGPFLASFSLAKQIEAEIEFMKAFEPDVVVSDSRVSSIFAAEMLKIPDICILNQFQIIIPRRTRFLRLARLVDAGTLAMIGKAWTSAKYLLIPDFPAPYTLSAGNLRIPKSYRKSVNLIGPILPIQPSSLPSKKELRERLGFDPSTPLIFAPISGPFQERAYLTNILEKILSNFPEHYQVVMSLGFPNSSPNPKVKGRVRIYNWVPNRFEYLKACDLVVSRAGHGTLTQSISYAKPMILIPTPNHTEQTNNARRAQDLGMAVSIKQPELTKRLLLEMIEYVLSEDCYEKNMEQIQGKISGINGLKAAVDTISKAGEKC